jgi:hypothetical protein
MKKILLIPVLIIGYTVVGFSQPCSPLGNETSYGTNNVWIGYAYDNMNLSSYKGYVTEGTAASPNFDESFGGDNVTYPTNGCGVSTTTFSMRYKLKKTFAAGSYTFTVGGDDGYRLSLDGGANWVINKWVDQSYASTTYTVSLNGTYNLVLEYYENGGSNRISFAVAAVCNGTENTTLYGTNNIWNGYVYDGINFDVYAGMVHEGAAADPAFDESFGGSNATYATSGCGVQTETYSVRYRLAKTFATGTYNFTVGGDDGYRFSLDGGATWAIDNWTLHSYTSTTSTTMSLSGSYNMVLEYYENSGDNRVTFLMRTLSLLPVSLESFNAIQKNNDVILDWSVSSGSNPKSFEVERSSDGKSFTGILSLETGNDMSVTHFTATDKSSLYGISYYRLKITDLTGVITYSKILSVNISAEGNNEVAFYPTVVSDGYVTLKSRSSVKNAVVAISDMSGRIISKQNIGNVTAGMPVRIAAADHKPGKGMYIVTLSGADFAVATGKIIIQ